MYEMTSHLDSVCMHLLQHKMFTIKSIFMFLAPHQTEQKRRVVITKPSKHFCQIQSSINTWYYND